jgi:hypothetical protein
VASKRTLELIVADKQSSPEEIESARQHLQTLTAVETGVETDTLIQDFLRTPGLKTMRFLDYCAAKEKLRAKRYISVTERAEISSFFNGNPVSENESMIRLLLTQEEIDAEAELASRKVGR